MGEVVQLQPRPDDYARALRRIKRLWDEGEVEFIPYAQKRMKERNLLPSDARDIIKRGRIVGHSKPDDYWRYELEGKLLDGGRASLIVEMANQLLIINFYPANRRRI